MKAFANLFAWLDGPQHNTRQDWDRMRMHAISPSDRLEIDTIFGSQIDDVERRAH